MALFRREPQSPAQPAAGGRQATAGRAAASLIAPGTRVEGTISGATEVVVEGELEGRVVLESTLTVGAQGSVRGEIRARTVRISGRVIGNVRGDERVEVAANGTLEGDVAAPRVAISEGAFFKGRVEMGSGAEAAGRPAAPAAEPSPERTTP